MISQDRQTTLTTATIDGLELRCTRCTAPFEVTFDTEAPIVCSQCHLPLNQKDGVWRALPVERAPHYARFIKEYEAIRNAEGRGSIDSSYYLNLPDVDRTNQNSSQWRIRARTYGFLQQHVLPGIISKTTAPRILDIGAGNGWLSYRLAQMGSRPTAVDLLVNTMDGLGAALHYDAHLKRPFLRFEAEYDRLPFATGQFDAAVFNASFHYATSYEQTLRETLRCLKVGGTIVIADSPWYSCQASGERMLTERRQHFFSRFGTFSDSIRSQEFLTNDRLQQLAQTFNLRWTRHAPSYGLRWAMRPWLAKLRNEREPSSFFIYTAIKHAS
jgi:SAM-dependent methyltransferase